MASSSSSNGSSNLAQKRFNVFISFRGVDTRHSFTDHLYTALKQAAIQTFRDDDEMKRGEDLAPELEKAIKTSRASIVVLSENYAKSRWCLEELSLILEQKRKGNHFVLPVFYHVDPSNVRNQRHSFAIEGSKWTYENVNRWKSALREVANLTGMVASGSEAELISKIVDTIYKELHSKPISTNARLTGMESRAEEITSWLNDEHSNTNVLAICGMGGIGKTTLAEYIYNLNKNNFESSCFLEDVGNQSKQSNGLLELQKLLLTKITGGKNILISCKSEGTTEITEALHMKKVLIVLDDIDDHDELSTLFGTSVVETKSKIILTTRLLDIHSRFESISWRCHVHELKLLNDDESLEVFSCHAFGSKHPPEGFSDLAIELAHYCGGNPLALKVLGSSLFVSAEDTQRRNKLEIWRSRLDSLSSMKGDLDSRIQSVLQKSFDSLPLGSDKELFLDIVAFFVGEDKDFVVDILEDYRHAKVGINTLINRCLITVSPKNKLAMHQLLQDMGKTIVRGEPRDYARHTRVGCSEEAYHILIKGEGSETIEGLKLDRRTLKKGIQAFTIKSGTLAKMHNLKLLQLKYVKVSGNFKIFPELRWLCWHGCNLKTIPSSILASSFLVAIDMTNGNLEKFEPPRVLSSLKILNLTACSKLIRIHKFCQLPNLENLILWDCWNLTHICETIQGLEKLALLNLTGCKNLWKGSWNKKLSSQHQKPLFSLPRSLKFLFLGFNNLKDHNDLCVLFNGPLYGLSLYDNPFEFMPSNIDLTMIRVLNLDSCYNLKFILCLPSTIEELSAYRCDSLEKVTFQSSRFTLRTFDFGGCFNLCEVQGLFKLVSIEELDEEDLGHMKWIKAYQDHKVNLVFDEDEGSIRHIQMLYEYGIRSTYLQGIKDQSMLTHEYMSSSNNLSFYVAFHPKKRKICGLNVTCLYKLSMPINRLALVIQISNITKGVSYAYNPMMFCKPKVDENVMWLSYWPIGNIIDTGDEVNVFICLVKGMIVSGCGASLVYIDDDGKVEQEAKRENKSIEMEEVIGGDLSEFEVSTGVYYLCRRDFIKWGIPEMKKSRVDDRIPFTELQGTRKSFQLRKSTGSCMSLNHAPELHKDTLFKQIIMANFNKESDLSNIKKAVYEVVGVDNVFFCAHPRFPDEKYMLVLGSFDSMAVLACVREFEKSQMLFDVQYNVQRYVKVYHTKIRRRIPEKLNSLILKIAIRRHNLILIP